MADCLYGTHYRGKEEAVQTLDQEAECSHVLHDISVARSAVDALMTGFRIPAQNGSAADKQTRAAGDLVTALRVCLK